MKFNTRVLDRISGYWIQYWPGSKIEDARTTGVRIQTDSGRIQLNTPRIQDSRFEVQGKLLPGILNLESEAYSIEYALNPFEYPVVGSGFRNCT